MLTVGFLANTASDDVVFSVELRDDESTVLMRTDTAIMGNTFGLAGPGDLEIQLKNVPMLDGEFTYCIGVQSRGGVLLRRARPGRHFEVMNAGKTTGSIFVPAEATLLAGDGTLGLTGGTDVLATGAELPHRPAGSPRTAPVTRRPTPGGTPRSIRPRWWTR